MSTNGDNTALSDKSYSLAKKMNKITERLTENLDISEELELTGADIIQNVQDKIQDINDSSDELDEILVPEIISLNLMVQDFSYIRKTLKENTNNGKRVLGIITLDLLDADDNKRESLISSFAELNRAIADNMKLFISAYKEISNTLLNINKIKQNAIGENKPNSVSGTEVVSTADLLKKMSK